MYIYRNLPKNWANNSWTTVNLPKPTKDKIEKAFGGLPDRSLKFFVSGDVASLVDLIVENGNVLADISGLDFIKYFENTIKGDRQKIPKDKFVIVYNVGLEPALNPAFGVKLLSGLIKEIEQNDCYLLIQSDLTNNEFNRVYNLNLTNKIRIPYKEEERIL